jgi:hypothetical protein
VESEDVAQDEDSERAGRQKLKASHERQGDRFSLLVAGFGTKGRVDYTFEEGVRKRLDPYDLA